MEDLLKQILSEIQSMKSDIHRMDSRIETMDSRIESMDSRIETLSADVTHLKEGQHRLEQKVDGIYKSVVRLEEGQPLDIISILHNIDRKLDLKDSEITVLNKRMFKVETQLESLLKS